jgi:SAM-dependent methyltransferase
VAVRGIDPVPRHLASARRRLEQAAQHDPSLRRLVGFGPGVAENLPAADGSIDLIWCRDVLVHAGELGTAYAEFQRVLRRGGHALIYQMFGTERLEPAEAAWLLPVLGCAAPNIDPGMTEQAIKKAGLHIDRRIILTSEWGEHAEEQASAGSRHLIHAARLLRDPGRYVREFGQANYDIALADCLWHIYRMIGKLSGRIYVLSAPTSG